LRHHRVQSLHAGQHFDVEPGGRGFFPFSSSGGTRVEHDRLPWPEVPALFEKTVNLGIGGQGHDPVFSGMSRQHIERIDPDRAGGSEDGYTA
jgi:hypothetical protein